VPGFGRSATPRDFDYTFKGFTRWLVALLDELGLPHAALAGNSMGGVISLLTALEHPARVEKLVLIGTPVYPHNTPNILWPMRWPVIGKVYESLLGPTAVRLVAWQCLGDRKLITDELVDEYSHSLRTRDGRRAVASFLRNAIPDDAPALMSRYPSLVPPTLVVHGARDQVVDRASAERFCREVPSAKLSPLDGLGHAPQETDPQQVADRVVPFLRGS
jgi:pimeloyl-ACP methyl ester carboxylesterase